MNKWIDVLYPRATHCATNKKKILFPSSFWGIFDFFVFFNNFGKKNKIMLRYKGELSVTNIVVPSIQNTRMFRAKRHMQ